MPLSTILPILFILPLLNLLIQRRHIHKLDIDTRLPQHITNIPNLAHRVKVATDKQRTTWYKLALELVEARDEGPVCGDETLDDLVGVFVGALVQGA
ncbi:hypothetical protein PtrM4_052470 [Pyrenophora tritici-repentis]|uniref:Uncharacterized protein n=1 Tax=Pyrenophora tritici-repentis TaxID=45151 RepID=A0A834RL62_9PLEO|nr:hypothetical protein PtrM4_052470 [Pyrenophora tritici-repentis]